jgi:hypothetical protein
MKQKQIYYGKVSLDNDFELYKNFVFLYCQKHFMEGRITAVPSDLLLKLLTMYVMYGFSKETRLKAVNFLKQKDVKRIDYLNHQLVRSGFLVCGASSQDKSLQAGLESIGEYLKQSSGEPIHFAFMFQLQVKTH